jgi:hypothetical protein
MACAPSQCYSTEPSKITFTQTITTTNAALGGAVTTTITATTTFTPTMPTAMPSSTDLGVPKYFPSYIEKAQPIVTQPDNSASGLSIQQIIGLAVGLGVFLIIVLVGAFIIIRHLNKVVKAVESSNKNSSSASKSRPPHLKFRPTMSEVADMSVDPLMMSPRPSHRRNDSDLDLVCGVNSPDYSPGIRAAQNAFGYHPVPTSGSLSDRNGSVDGVYFDSLASPQSQGQQQQNQRQSQNSSSGPSGPVRVSTDSQGTHGSYGTYGHGRQFSNASEASSDVGSNGAITPLVLELEATSFVPELPASPTVDTSGGRRRSSGTSGSSPLNRPPLAHQRRRSDGHIRGRSDSSAAGAPVTQLDVVNESAEIHGYYGPPGHVGQTAAGLNRVNTGESSK